MQGGFYFYDQHQANLGKPMNIEIEKWVIMVLFLKCQGCYIVLFGSTKRK